MRTADASGEGVALVSPWAEGAAVRLDCTRPGGGGGDRPVEQQRTVRPDAQGRLRWAMARGEVCRVEPV